MHTLNISGHISVNNFKKSFTRKLKSNINNFLKWINQTVKNIKSFLNKRSLFMLKLYTYMSGFSVSWTSVAQNPCIE